MGFYHLALLIAPLLLCGSGDLTTAKIFNHTIIGKTFLKGNEERQLPFKDLTKKAANVLALTNSIKSGESLKDAYKTLRLSKLPVKKIWSKHAQSSDESNKAMLKVLRKAFGSRNVARMIAMGKQRSVTSEICKRLEAAQFNEWKTKHLSVDQLFGLLHIDHTDLERSSLEINIFHTYSEYLKWLLNDRDSVQNAFQKLRLDKIPIRSTTSGKLMEDHVANFFESLNFNAWKEHAEKEGEQADEAMFDVLIHTFTEDDVAIMIEMGKQSSGTSGICKRLEAVQLDKWETTQLSPDQLLALLRIDSSNLEPASYQMNIVHNYLTYLVNAKKRLIEDNSVQDAFKKLGLDKVTIKSTTSSEIAEDLVMNFFEDFKFVLWMEHAQKQGKQADKAMFDTLLHVFGEEDVAIMIEMGKQSTTASGICAMLEAAQFEEWASNNLSIENLLALLRLEKSDLGQTSSQVNIVNSFLKYTKTLFLHDDSVQDAFKKLGLDQLTITTTTGKVTEELARSFFEDINFSVWAEYTISKVERADEEILRVLTETFNEMDVAMMIEMIKPHAPAFFHWLEAAQFKTWGTRQLSGDQLLDLLRIEDLNLRTTSYQGKIFHSYLAYLKKAEDLLHVQSVHVAFKQLKLDKMSIKGTTTGEVAEDLVVNFFVSIEFEVWAAHALQKGDQAEEAMLGALTEAFGEREVALMIEMGKKISPIVLNSLETAQFRKWSNENFLSDQLLELLRIEEYDLFTPLDHSGHNYECEIYDNYFAYLIKLGK